VIKTYVKYFAGENYADAIKKEQLGEIESTQSGDSGDQGEGDEQKNPEQQQTDTHNAETPEKPVSESILYISRLDRMVENTVDMIFEALDPKSGYGLIKGYGIFYHCNSFGERLKTLKSAGSKANQTLFSGVLADLANVKIKTLGGGEIAIGKAIAKGMRAFQRTRININDVDNHIRGIIKNDFPQSSAIVRVYDVMSLRRMIENTEKYKTKLGEFDRICGIKASKPGEDGS